MTTMTMDTPKSFFNFSTFRWQTVAMNAVVAGIILLFVGLVGMLQSFDEREIIRDYITLGQLLLVFPAFILGYNTAKSISQTQNPIVGIVSAVLVGVLSILPTFFMVAVVQTENPWLILIPTVLLGLFVAVQLGRENLLLGLVVGGVAGVIASLPVIFMVYYGKDLNVRDILVNLNRDWIKIITFDNRDEWGTGMLFLTELLAVASLVGAILSQVPNQVRRALIIGISVTTLIAIMGGTAQTLLEENAPESVVKAIFQRDSLKLEPAIALFVGATALSLLWTFVVQPWQGRTKVQSSASPNQRYIQIGLNVLLLVVLLLLPWRVGRNLSEILVQVGIYILMGLGLNIAIGLTGMLNLGYVVSFAVGAYTVGVLTSLDPNGFMQGNGLNFWLVIPIAILIAMAISFIFAVPILKMRGDYLAIATLGFGEIINAIAVSDWFAPLMGGAQGVGFIPKPNFFGIELINPEQLYYLVLAACILVLLISIRLNNSRIGRQWMAIREDEDVARAMGIDTPRSKLLSFTLSAAAGGLAGAIFAAKLGTVFPNSFTTTVSINVLSLIIVGGLGSNIGIVFGGLALVGLPEILREFTDYRWMIYGALLIFMMLNRPEGLLPSQSAKRELKADPHHK